ncbi:hypothetical protein ACIBQ1_09680 [Nonomuraea sp. NPDC050153]|uniref:hypothetical protein n=1 Tax=Nonomuraea sp. NPDC050153 TaxID=3364359 RepID=UPI0037B3BEBE
MATDSEAAAEARAILREDAPRSAPEQAAIDALDQYRWVMVHAYDYSLGVIRLLSNAGLLRDLAHEKQEEANLISNARLIERDRKRDARRITALDTAIQQACDRLSTGDDPGEVAAWLKDVRARLT